MQALEQEAPHVGLAPAVAGHDRRVLGRQHEQRIAPVSHLVVLDHGQRGGQRRAEIGRGAAALIVHGDRRVGRQQRHGVVAGREAVLHRQRVPRAGLLALPDAVGIAAGMRERRHADDTGPGAAHVDADEAQGAADRRVGAPARSEQPGAAVDVQAVADRPVDDDQRRRRVGRRRDAVQVERVVAHRFHCRDHHRQVVGPAARHDRVDRDLLDGGAAVVGRHLGDQLVGGAARRLDGARDPLGRGRHHRQAVGHAARVELLDRIGSGERHALRLTQARMLTAWGQACAACS